MEVSADKILKEIDGVGVYFVESVNNKLLESIKQKLKKPVISVMNDSDKRLAIEVKGQVSMRELMEDFGELSAIHRDNISTKRIDAVVDTEKFLRHLFRKDSELPKKYIVLVDVGILNRTLKGDDGNLINLQIV